MKISGISKKLFLAIFLTAGISVVSVMLIQRYSFQQGFQLYSQEVALNRLKGFSELLITDYEKHGNWGFIKGAKEWPVKYLGHTLRRPGRTRDGAKAGFPSKGFLGKGLVAESDRREKRPFGPIKGAVNRNLSLADSSKQWVAGPEISSDGLWRKLTHNGQTIGFLIFAPSKRFADRVDQQFSEKQLSNLYIAAVIVFLAAALAAAILSRHLAAPMLTLTRATKHLKAGKYETRITTGLTDEIGQLMEDFNELAAVLEKGRTHRREWVANISHELRTPITILQAELEAIEDGYQTFDSLTLHAFAKEVARIRILVDDLHQLAQQDSGTIVYTHTPFDVFSLIQEIAKSLEPSFPDQKIVIGSSLEKPCFINADENRIRQVFLNLLRNSLSYTNIPGIIEVSSQLTTDRVKITIEDSPPGVPDESLERLFERFYRVDPSRNRKTGASGLGLAICQGIIAAHEGTVNARRSSLGGLAVDVTLVHEKGVAE